MKYLETGRTRSDAKRKWQVMVDDEDYEWLRQYEWQVDRHNSVKTHAPGMKGKLIHRLILNAPEHLEVDHIDGNRLNNQRSNLRLATSSQNKMNRGPRKDNTSGCKGVSWHSQRLKWTARVKAGQKYIHLGLFDSKEAAALAYNATARQLHGEYAWLNNI